MCCEFEGKYIYIFFPFFSTFEGVYIILKVNKHMIVVFEFLSSHQCIIALWIPSELGEKLLYQLRKSIFTLAIKTSA